MATNEDIKITITAEDKASGILAGLGKAAGGLGSALTDVAKIAGTALVAGFGAAVAFGVSSVKEFIEAEQQMVTANQALENTLKGLSEQQMANVAESKTFEGALKEVQRNMEDVGKAALKLGFDDEAASLAFAKLLSVTKDVSQAQADLKLAMDLAAFSGKTLEESAAAITKVHAGSARVLVEFGIAMDNNATSADALAALQDRVTGSAATMAETTGVKLEILRLSWGNLKEQVGGTLAQAITPFITTLSAWAQNPEVQKKFQDIADKIAALATQLGPMITALLPALIGTFDFLIATLGFLSQAFIGVTNFIGGFIFQIMQMIEWVKKIPEEVNRAIEALNRLAAKVPGSGGLGFTNKIGDSISNFITGRASGGPVSAGDAYVVGENGPELFLPGRSGQILASGGSLGGSAAAIVVNITGTFLSQDVAMQLGDLMITRLKQELRI